MDVSELYLIKDRPASPPSTLVLQPRAQNGARGHENDAYIISQPDTTAFVDVTRVASPYMRSSQLSSPQPFISESGLYEHPPESSSPLLSSSSSIYSSHVVALSPSARSSDTSSSSTSSIDGSSRGVSDTALLNGPDSSSNFRYDLLLPVKETRSDNRVPMDGFARCLYERLLVVARERQMHTGNSTASSTPLRGRVYVLSGDNGLLADFLDTCNGDLEMPLSHESDLETPSFASPPRSENITPKKFRKRLREMNSIYGGSCSSSRAHQQEKENQCDRPPYRIIWRAESFQVFQNRCSQREEGEKDAPPLKRQKANSYTHRQLYASKPASLRRAASLKSDYEYPLRSCSPYSDQGLVPTEAATPIPSNHGSFLKYGVPIIAPPPDHVGSLPIGMETLAKIRIRRSMEKEIASREADGLGIPQEGDGISLRRVWSSRTNDSTQKDLWEKLLTIGRLREDVIDWLLSVLPPDRRSRRSTAASSFSSSTSHSSISTGNCPVDLFDELTSSPETRFHAAYIFLRFFYRVMSGESDLEQESSIDGTTKLHLVGKINDYATVGEEGRELVIWDMAVGSLALSIKFHRDVLEPLSPVLAWEYLELAPHRLSFDDLESAQRDVFSALSYNLGGTPQPLLDNIWLSLPALRYLFDYEGGWNYALRETWINLFDAVSEPDVLQFPLSLLTVACVVEGILTALAHKHEYKLTWRKSIVRAEKNKKSMRQRITKMVREEAEGVIHDIQAIVEISDARLAECRSWLARMHEGQKG